MRLNFKLLLLFCITTITTHAQDHQSPLINLGDPAPPLRVREWLKGSPVQRFEKGHVYVLEFWATWCKPCIAAMPHLSALGRAYKEKVTIIGIDVMETKTTPLEKVKAVVDRMGLSMDFPVAVEDSNFMVSGWLEATGEQDNGIPRTIVVDGEGRLAWIGHPTELVNVLPHIVNNTWNVQKALVKHNENKRLQELDKETRYILMEYKADQFKAGSVDKPDSALLAINEIVRKEPKLKYAPIIASYTFSFLLQTDQNKAYLYGKEVLVNPSYEAPAYDAITNNINWYSDKIKLTAQIYELAAEAYQVEIDQVVFPELVNVSRLYSKMADMYWRANIKVKAIGAQQKAIESLKGQQTAEMGEFEDRLQQYKNMKPEE